MTQTTNEAWKKALEQMDLAGWHYDFCMSDDAPAYRYVTKDKHIYAVVSDKAVVIGVMFGAELFRRQRTNDNPYFALAKAAHSADELAGTYKDIESRLEGKL